DSALNTDDTVSESAVVGINDELTGQAICCFITLKPDHLEQEEAGIKKALTLQIRKVIGPFALPKQIYIVEDLPKTRSGKIIRRVLRKIVAGEADSLGDLSTMSDPSVVDGLIDKVTNSA
ncbi:acetyl-coenzyme A synthetase 2, partial [Basidiobolus ranarum]